MITITIGYRFELFLERPKSNVFDVPGSLELPLVGLLVLLLDEPQQLLALHLESIV